MRSPQAAQRRAVRSSIGRIVGALVVLGIASVTDSAVGQGPQLAPPSQEEVQPDRVLASLERRGDLTLRNSTLEGALFTISELWGINIVAGGVEGSVNGVFKDAPLREILDSILLANGYAYRPVGASLVVSKLSELGQVNPFFESATIPIGSAEVGEVVEAARLMSTPQGQIRALPSAGAILVVDFPDRVAKIRALVKDIAAATGSTGRRTSPGGAGPQQAEVAYFRTHYINSTDAVAALTSVLSPVGRLASVDSENRLVVIDYAENVRMIESLLARLDRPRPQVNIKALIYDIALSDLEQIGINWGGRFNGTADATTGAPTSGDGALVSSVTKQPFGASSPGNTFTFFSLNSNFDLQAVVRALQRAEDSRLLADPNVTVQDNEQASIESISEIPFQQLTQTAAGGQIGTTAFKTAGIKLDVLPRIARDGTIDMTVVPEYSRLAGFTPGDNQPIIDTRRATTRLRIANEQTLMIAGMRQRSDVGDFNGIPYLKDIRYLGALFRARSTDIKESELVVFLTPHISGYSDPLGARDQATADTIGCRLERIPGAEGCPSCGPCDPSLGPIEPQGAVLEGQPAPTPAEVTPAPSEGAEEVLPLGPTPDSASLEFPEIAATARRLPIDGMASRTDRTADGPSVTPLESDEAAPKKTASQRVSEMVFLPPTEKMRRGYDERFRATGSVFPDRQRMASLPEEMQAPPREASPKVATEKKSFMDRVFLR